MSTEIISWDVNRRKGEKILKKLIFKIKMGLDKEEIEVLTKALNLYIHAGTTFDYPEQIEICRDILMKRVDKTRF